MVIDLSFLNIEASIIIWIIRILGGLITLLIAIFVFRFLLLSIWLPSRQEKYLSSLNFILLAIDIPKENEQSPKAVEHIFSTLAGILGGVNLYEKYWLGIHQLSLSMEVVSLEGYIQFYIHLPEKFKDTVEAAFYAQYPAAEITETEDYTKLVSTEYPSDSFDLWGTDFKLGKESAYPIRTYPNFEHTLSQEFKDPMASLLEVFSRAGKGEYIWLQWIIAPIGDSWKEESDRVVKKLIGAKAEAKADFSYYLTYPFLSFMKWLGDVLVVTTEGGPDENTSKTDNNKELNRLLYLTAGEKDIIQAIEDKMAKIGFSCKGRLIYVARREVFNKSKCVNSSIGALNQFNTLNLNYFTKVKTTTTKADYIRADKRIAAKQNRIIKAYRKRDGSKKFGSNPFILNIEELATLYHFPGTTVKAPLVKTTEAKRSEPPAQLPMQINDQSGGIRVEVVEHNADFVSPTEDIVQRNDWQVKVEESVAEKKNDFSKDAEATKQESARVVIPELLDENNKAQVKKDKIQIKKDSPTSNNGAPPANLPI